MHQQQANGDRLVQDKDTTKKRDSSLMSDDDFAVLNLRNLLFDICNQNGGGHGGSAIGMAAIGVALYKYTMRYSPSNAEWFDRDRFVLSNGEFCCPDAKRRRTHADPYQAMPPCSSTL